MGINRRRLLYLMGAGSALAGGLNAIRLSEKRSGILRFATWNLAAAAPLYHGRGLPEAAQWIRDNGIDVCSLQETDRFAKTSGMIDFPAYLAAETGFDTVYGASSIGTAPQVEGYPARQYGNCLISRFPMVEKYVLPLVKDQPHKAGVPEWGRDNRVAVAARIVPDGRGLLIAGTHLSAFPEARPVRAAQVLNLLDQFKRVAGNLPIILGGDMNCEADAYSLGPLRKEMVCLTADIGPTWPLYPDRDASSMQVTLDHIFTRAVAAAGPVRVYPMPKISDHALVVVDLRL